MMARSRFFYRVLAWNVAFFRLALDTKQCNEMKEAPGVVLLRGDQDKLGE